MSGMHSAFFDGAVTHRRWRPRAHRLAYRVYAMLLDLDEVDGLARSVTGFSHNRFNLLSFWDKDHGPGDGSPLRPWLEAQLAKAGIDLAGGRVLLLTYPRVLGYVFSPLSVYFCHDAGGALVAIVYEVNNTFGERHCYLIPVTGTGAVIRQRCRKAFYVSPFLPMEAQYAFRIRRPGERIGVAIRESDGEGVLLDAAFSGRRMPFTARACWRLFITRPLMTLKVLGGIQWHGFKLWRKNLPLHKRPSPPAEPVTIVAEP